MNPFDIIAILVMSYSPIRGVFRGIIKEIASIIGIIYGFFTAYTHYSVGTDILSQWIPETLYLKLFCFLFIFCGIFIIINVIGVIIRYIMNAVSLGWLDRIFGLAFGLVKGVLIVSVILITLATFLPKDSTIIKDSTIAPHITSISEEITKLVSKEKRKIFADKISGLKNAWNGF